MSWNKDMSTAPKDGSDIWLFFPLEGLDHNLWQQVMPCHWNEETKMWTWKGRAYRSYSRDYRPTHWQLLTDNKPEPPMNYNDIKIGEYYKFKYDVSNPTLGAQLIFIVGRDPFTGQLVAVSDEWLNKVDLLTNDDFQFLEPI